MVYHAVAVLTQLKSVALSTLFPSLPNKRHSSDVFQSVTLPTFVKCRTSDEMWSDVLNVALPNFVNYHNYDEMWSDVCKLSQFWRNVVWRFGRRSSDGCKLSQFRRNVVRRFGHCSSDVFKLSQFRRNVVRRFYIVSLPTFLGCSSSDVYKASVDRQRVQFKKKN